MRTRLAWLSLLASLLRVSNSEDPVFRTPCAHKDGHNCEVKKQVLLDSWSQVSSGDRHTCAIVKSNHCHGAKGVCSVKGAVECFGDDSFGQAEPPPGAYSQVASGRDVSCAIKADGGAVVCWGNPVSPVVMAVPRLYGFEEITVGSYHACGLRQKRVQCWGSNSMGQLTPPDASSLFTNVAAGSYHTCAVQSQGYVSCWGYDGEKESSGYPRTQRFTQVTAGNGHSCGVTIHNRALCWGRNREGQAGAPKEGAFFASLSAGHRHTCGVRHGDRSADAVVCWGSNYQGESRARFRGRFGAVASGAFHSCALSETGDLRCWGSNKYGQAIGSTRTGLRGAAGELY